MGMRGGVGGRGKKRERRCSIVRVKEKGDVFIQSYEVNYGILCLPEAGENVSGTGCIFASMETSTKLTNGKQEIQVVGAHKILGQVDDGSHQRCLKIKRF